MPRKMKPQIDIRDTKATVVILDAGLTFNGGTLDSDVTYVWLAIKAALAKAAHERGLGFSWTASLHCMKPEVLARRIQRLHLTVEEPPADDAVDPHV